jgi:acyl-CoA synthetase (AMP-forming)/AMP-acid ligase II
MNFWDIDHPRNALALIDEATGRRWTYGDLKTAAVLFTAKLGRKNQKQLGFIMCSNTPECVAAYVGALQANAAAALFPADLPSEHLSRLLSIYRPDWVFGSTSMKRPGDYTVVATFGKYNLWGSHHPEDRTISPDLGLLLSTSGSTGTSKLVRLSHFNLQSNAASIRQYLELDDHARPVTSLPMAYSYGLSVINSHLLAGAAILLTNQTPLQKAFWSFVSAEEASSFAGVPYTYQMMLRTGIMHRDLSISTWTQAGGRLEPKYLEQLYEIAVVRDWRFFVMYGQTEATARISYLPPEMLENNAGSIGIPIPGGNLRVDPASSELLYYGPNVMMGYAQSLRDLSKGDELVGELRTGDLARQDANGLFYITGRNNRFLKVMGLRISLDDVEVALSRHFDFPLACFGTDDALHVAVEDASSTEAALRICCELFSLDKSVIRVTHVEQMPLTSYGKTDYTALASLAATASKHAAAGQ